MTSKQVTEGLLAWILQWTGIVECPAYLEIV
jgi:hypothetical protein